MADPMEVEGTPALTRVQFNRPAGVEVVDRLALFVLHEDGIQCGSQFSNGPEYLCVTLELLNCNQNDRIHRGMTIFAGVLQRKSKESTLKMRHFMDEYARTCTVTGLKGAYILNHGQWEHWRWVIKGICCDYVAEQQIVGETNKMNTGNPCFGRKCEKVVLSYPEGSYKPFKEKRPQGLGKELVVFDPAFNCFPNWSCYRLTPFIAHCENPLCCLDQLSFNFSSGQLKEITCVSAFIQRFPKGSFHQYLPVITKLDGYTTWRRKEIAGVLNDEQKASAFLSVTGDSDAATPDEVSLHPERALLLPPEITMVLDFMHFVSNVTKGFLDYLSEKKRDETNQEYVDTHAMLSLYDRYVNDFTLFYLEKDVMEKATKRLKELPKVVGMEWLKEEILAPNKFKALKCHDNLVFAFALFAYTFQDSMKHPSVWAMKNILDGLSFMFNFDGSYEELLKCQAMIDFSFGILQGEINPSSVSPSMHNVTHGGQSILIHDSPARNNCFTQERLYQIAKALVLQSSNPALTVQERLLVNNVCAIFSFLDDVAVDEYSVSETLLPERKWWLLCRIDSEMYSKMTTEAINEDSLFYESEVVPMKTLLDCIMERGLLKKDWTELKRCVMEYKSSKHRWPLPDDIGGATSSSENPVDSRRGDPIIAQHRIKTVFSKVRSAEGLTCGLLERDIPDVDTRELYRSIGFTRLFNGRVEAFIILGFVEELVNKYSYVQALCVHLPTISGNSFIDTQHYGIIDKSITFPESLFDLVNTNIIPIPLTRLVLNRALVVDFSAAARRKAICYAKLCIKQAKSLQKNELLEFINQSARNRQQGRDQQTDA